MNDFVFLWNFFGFVPKDRADLGSRTRRSIDSPPINPFSGLCVCWGGLGVDGFKTLISLISNSATALSHPLPSNALSFPLLPYLLFSSHSSLLPCPLLPFTLLPFHLLSSILLKTKTRQEINQCFCIFRPSFFVFYFYFHGFLPSFNLTLLSVCVCVNVCVVFGSDAVICPCLPPRWNLLLCFQILFFPPQYWKTFLLLSECVHIRINSTLLPKLNVGVRLTHLQG